MYKRQPDPGFEVEARPAGKPLAVPSPTPGAAGGPWNVPERQASRFFVGREALLDDLHKRLAAGEVVALHGLPGVGKTQTALAYAARHRADYLSLIHI